MKTKMLALLVSLSAILVGCASPEYEKRDSTTDKLTSNTIRYGSTAGLGAGGYFAGKELGGSTEWGIIGAGAGLATGVVANKYIDSKQNKAYNAGKIDGAEEARAEIAKEQWLREAVYGKPGPTGATGVRVASSTKGSSDTSYSKIRRVYVPSRTINGVTYPGGYQTVELDE